MIHVTDCLPWFGPDLDPIYLERGTHVHAACHLLDTVGLNWESVYEPWLGYVRAWERCKEEAGIYVVASEVPVVHEAAGYCGRLDRLLKFQGHHRHVYVTDLKTGQPTAMVGKQVAAYLEAVKAMVKAGLLPKEYLPDRRAVCWLKEDGKYRLVTEETPKQDWFSPIDYRVFLAYLLTYSDEIAHNLRQPKERDDE
jgi:hypothetical protein